MEKIRLDVYLVENGYIDSRSRAKSFIEGEREVYINDKRITKPSFKVSNEDKIEIIKLNDTEYVSRAGYKLEKAINHWDLNLQDKTCLDIGASTGGFTECCLLNGAKNVVSVDVGHDQLHKSLLENNKVINIEGFNFKEANKSNLNYKFDFWCCDVSFISLEHILKPLSGLDLSDNAFGVMLIKPQFESQPDDIKNGRAMTKELHYKAITKVINLAKDNNFIINDIDYSPIKGNKKNNIEYLILLSINNKLDQWKDINKEYIDSVINKAWEQ